MKTRYFTVLAILEAKPGKENELTSILTNLVVPTLQELGCVNYDLHISPDNPRKFMFYENWENKDAHNKHCETPHIKAWQEQMHELLAKPYEVTFWEQYCD